MSLTYQSLQKYCLEIMEPVISKERFQEEIRCIYFKDRIHGNAEIRDEASYRLMIDRCLKDQKK